MWCPPQRARLRLTAAALSRRLSHSSWIWLALALGVAVLVISDAAQTDRSRGLVQRILDGGFGVLAVVTIVFSLVFSDAAVQWLSFAAALGFIGLAYSGLAINEVAEWRAEHGLAPLHGLHVVPSRDRSLAA
jgi:hypothetical protein